MGDQNTTLSLDEVRHVMRRTGFGAPPRDLLLLTKFVGETPTRGALADYLLNYKPKNFKPGGNSTYTAHAKWIKFLLTAKSPLQAKLALFWHDHFSVNNTTVMDAKLMGYYVQLLHLHPTGNMKTFVKAVNKNAAMMDFLDTVRNRKAIPNENYGRELCELFTLGVFDLAGNPNYMQEDIVQIARAFTGWRYGGSKGDPYLNEDQHDYMDDYPARGPKVIFQSTGGFGAGGRNFAASGEGEPEIDVVTDILFDHVDSDGKNTVARRTTKRLLEFYCHGAYANPGPAEIAVIDQIVDASNFDVSFDLKALCRAIFTHDVFFESAAPVSPTSKKSVKWPIDYFITTLKLTGMKLKGADQYVPGVNYRSSFDHMVEMGQTLLEPPTVFGWDWEGSWISSTTLLARFSFARDIVSSRGSGKFRPEKLVDLGLSDPDDIIDAVTDALGIADQVSVADREVFIDYLTDGGMSPTLDLEDYDVRNIKLHGLFALVMQSPAYQLH